MLLKTVKLGLLSLVVAIALTGCLSATGSLIEQKMQPSKEEVAAWNFGPFPADYKQMLANRQELRSGGYSKVYVEYQGRPEKTWVYSPKQRGYVYGWGGYASRTSRELGTVKYRYIIRNGKFLLLEETEGNDTFTFVN